MTSRDGAIFAVANFHLERIVGIRPNDYSIPRNLRTIRHAGILGVGRNYGQQELRPLPHTLTGSTSASSAMSSMASGWVALTVMPVMGSSAQSL